MILSKDLSFKRERTARQPSLLSKLQASCSKISTHIKFTFRTKAVLLLSYSFVVLSFIPTMTLIRKGIRFPSRTKSNSSPIFFRRSTRRIENLYHLFTQRLPDTALGASFQMTGPAAPGFISPPVELLLRWYIADVIICETNGEIPARRIVRLQP